VLSYNDDSFPLQVCWWDDRKGGKPEGEINLSVSHIEPVYKTMWISSKTASEFFTASTDGTVWRGYLRTVFVSFVSRFFGGISGILKTPWKGWCWTLRLRLYGKGRLTYFIQLHIA
jgi:hypothetical protein